MNQNEISDINVLDKVNFKELNELNLRSNKISDISLFEKVNFKELDGLDLKNNLINENDSILVNLSSKIKNLFIF